VDIENFCQAQAAVNFDDYSGKSGSGWSVGRVRPFVRACVALISKSTNKSTKVTKYTENSWLSGGVRGKSGNGWRVGRVTRW